MTSSRKHCTEQCRSQTETNDSYLARHDVHFEELLSQGVTFEQVRAYILLRQSAALHGGPKEDHRGDGRQLRV